MESKAGRIALASLIILFVVGFILLYPSDPRLQATVAQFWASLAESQHTVMDAWANVAD